MQGITTLKSMQALITTSKKHQMIYYENMKYRIVHSIWNVGLGIQYKANVEPKMKTKAPPQRKGRREGI
jgi:hypothetical protein